jgi:hypothetical protein
VASKPKWSVLAPGDCGESGVTPLTCSEEIDLMSESFSAFREQYLSRHENPVNSALHTVADVVEVGGLAAGVVTRRIRVALIGDTVGFAIATVGHLFQPGTLQDDLVEDFRHPIWAVRAEGQRIFARPT